MAHLRVEVMKVRNEAPDLDASLQTFQELETKVSAVSIQIVSFLSATDYNNGLHRTIAICVETFSNSFADVRKIDINTALALDTSPDVKTVTDSPVTMIMGHKELPTVHVPCLCCCCCIALVIFDLFALFSEFHAYFLL